MNVRNFGHKLSAVGTLLTGGSVATAFLTTVPAGTDGAWTTVAHNIALGSIILGAALSSLGKVVSTWVDDDSAPVAVPEPLIYKSTLPLSLVVIALLFSGFAYSPPLYASEGQAPGIGNLYLCALGIFVIGWMIGRLVMKLQTRMTPIDGGSIHDGKLHFVQFHRAPGVLIALLVIPALLMLPGCNDSAAVAQANADAQTAVNALAATVPGTANFIATTWANHETALAKRRYAGVRAENSVLVTVPATAPTGTTPATILNPAPIRVVPEPLNATLQAQYDSDLAQIPIGQQQIYQAVINQYAGNLAAVQALQTGQANYYATAGAAQSTLSTGLNATLAAFQQFAPVIAAAVTPAPKTPPSTTAATKTKVAGIKIGGVGIGVTTTSK